MSIPAYWDICWSSNCTLQWFRAWFGPVLPPRFALGLDACFENFAMNDKDAAWQRINQHRTNPDPQSEVSFFRDDSTHFYAFLCFKTYKPESSHSHDHTLAETSSTSHGFRVHQSIPRWQLNWDSFIQHNSELSEHIKPKPYGSKYLLKGSGTGYNLL